MRAYTQIDLATVPALVDFHHLLRGGPRAPPSFAAPDRHLGVHATMRAQSRFRGRARPDAGLRGRALIRTRVVVPQPTPQVRLGLGCLMAGCVMRAWARSWVAGPALPYLHPYLAVL